MKTPILLISLLFFFTSLAQADSRSSHYKVSVTGSQRFLTASVGDSYFVSIKTFEGIHRYLFKRHETQNVPCEIDGEKQEDSCLDASLRIFKGRAVGSARYSIALGEASASVLGNNLSLTFYGRRGKRAYVYEFDLVQNEDLEEKRYGRLKQIRISLGVGCDDKDTLFSDSTIHSSNRQTRAKGRVDEKKVEFGLELDAQFVKKFKGVANASAQAQAIVAATSSIYEKQLGVAFVINKISVNTDKKLQPFKTKNPNKLLSKFRMVSEESLALHPSDVRILFSGKNFKGPIIGLAYTSSACRSPLFSYAIVQKTQSALRPILLAHEIGHIFGASHDNSKPKTIMSSKLSKKQAKKKKGKGFSDQSLSQMLEHIDDNGSCVSEISKELPTRPTIEEVSLSDSGNFRVEIEGIGSIDCKIRILISDGKSSLSGVPIVASLSTSEVNEGILVLTASGVLVDRNALKSLHVIARKSCDDFSDSYSIESSGEFIIGTSGTISSISDVAQQIASTLKKG